MSNHRIALTCAVVLTAVGANSAAHAGSPRAAADSWTADATVECADLEYRDAVTARFPEIAQACQAVVRDTAGSPYVQVDAVVHSIRRSSRDRTAKRITLDLLDERGGSLRKLSFVPPRGFTYSVDGETRTTDQMARGQNLRIYLPPDRWEIAWTLETATPLDTKIHVEDIDTFLVTSTLEADEAFQFDSDALSEDGKAELRGIVDLFDEYVPAISIYGYTDSIGKKDYNQELSQRRADSARDYLVSLGVPAERVSSVGRGDSNPVVSCDGIAGAELKACLGPNRRAEVVFVIPAVGDVGTVQVTKTYVKPRGERVQITETLGVARIEEMPASVSRFMTTCASEIDTYCGSTTAGDGRLLGCLVSNMQAGYDYSADCDSELARLVDAVSSRRSRLNAVGSACSAELARCDDAPMGSELDCVRSGPKSAACDAAMSALSSAAF